MMVVEQPCVEIALAKSRLNGGEVHDEWLL